MKTALAIFVAALLVAPVMAKDMHGLLAPSSAALFTEGAGIMPRVNQAYMTGFEPNFALGTLDGQFGWAQSGVNLPWSSVSNLGPKTGIQHDRQIFDPTQAQGVGRVVNSPLYVADPNTDSYMDVDVRISGTGGADYDFGPQSPTDGFVVARVKNNYLYGGVYVLTIDPNNVLGWAYTGFDYTPGVYYHMRIDVHPSTMMIDYTINGTLYGSAPAPTTSTRMQQFYTVSDNWQLTGEYADYDNVTFPEPASFALLALVALLRRR